jgi:hypothetical protein
MIELIILAVGFIVGSVFGYFKGTHDLIDMLVKHPDELDKLKRQLANISKPEVPKGREEPMTIERHGDELYAFTDTGDFLAQAPTMTSLLQRIEQRYPHRQFKGEISAKQAKEMGIVQ